MRWAFFLTLLCACNEGPALEAQCPPPRTSTPAVVEMWAPCPCPARTPVYTEKDRQWTLNLVQYLPVEPDLLEKRLPERVLQEYLEDRDAGKWRGLGEHPTKGLFILEFFDNTPMLVWAEWEEEP